MSSSLSKDAIQLQIFKKIHIKGVNFGLIFQLTSLILFIHQHQRCSVRKVFLEISQNSQENIYARCSSLMKLQASATGTNTFFTQHLQATVSLYQTNVHVVFNIHSIKKN